MSKRIKVYAWLAFHPQTGEQVRCIMSAVSVREVRDACDALRIWPGRGFIGTTGNANEIRHATECPQQVLWAKNEYRDVTFEPWPKVTR